MVNLNDNTPAAPTGGTNVKWQEDASGNVSAYVGVASTGTPVAPVVGVVTANVANTNVIYVNVNAAVTQLTITNPTDKQVVTVFWIQDGTGHAAAYGSGFIGATAPSTGANTHSIQQFLYYAANTTWYGVAIGQTGL